MDSLPIVLGSSSKWRHRVLADILQYHSIDEIKVISPNIDEKAIRHDDPRVMVMMIAEAKAKALLPQLADQPCILICSDQVTLCQGQVREKPIDEREAKKFLESYRKHPAQVLDAVVVTNTQTGEQWRGLETAQQVFNPYPDSFIDELIEQGDVFHTSGGFVIELMEPYRSSLEGEIETILGMPRTLTLALIEKAKHINTN